MTIMGVKTATMRRFPLPMTRRFSAGHWVWRENAAATTHSVGNLRFAMSGFPLRSATGSADEPYVFWVVSDSDMTAEHEQGYCSAASLGATLPIGDYLVTAYMPGIGEDGSMVHCSTNVLHVTAPRILSIDLMDAVNEPAHHTELYATNALVVRRAQKFRVGTKMSKDFDPARFQISFKMVDEFGDAPTTNDVPCSAGDMSHTNWYNVPHERASPFPLRQVPSSASRACPADSRLSSDSRLRRREGG